MKRLLAWWREHRFKKNQYGTSFLIPLDKYDAILYYPPPKEVAEMLDTVAAPRAQQNWYKIGMGLKYGRMRPEFLAWLEEYGPYEVKTASFTTLHTDEIIAGMGVNVHKRIVVRLCHPESVALFKLTWL